MIFHLWTQHIKFHFSQNIQEKHVVKNAHHVTQVAHLCCPETVTTQNPQRNAMIVILVACAVCKTFSQ